jgi:hypothetical protein
MCLLGHSFLAQSVLGLDLHMLCCCMCVIVLPCCSMVVCIAGSTIAQQWLCLHVWVCQICTTACVNPGLVKGGVCVRHISSLHQQVSGAAATWCCCRSSVVCAVPVGWVGGGCSIGHRATPFVGCIARHTQQLCNNTLPAMHVDDLASMDCTDAYING